LIPAVAVLVEAIEIFLVEIVSSGRGYNLSAREALRCLAPDMLRAEPDDVGFNGGPSTAEFPTGDIIC
jgi:hypothetical protein